LLSPGLAAVPVPATIPGTLNNTGGTVTYAGGGHYDWEINISPAARALRSGLGSSQHHRALVISATSGNKFKINVAGLVVRRQ
jgi:hypothetical protein